MSDTFIGIRIHPRNYGKIRASVPDTILPDEDLDAMVEEYSHHANAPIYFRPIFNKAKGCYVSWGTTPLTYAIENYEYDRKEAENKFTRFTSK